MLGRIILFGASGDLASRYFVPALVRLRQHGHLPQKLKIQTTGAGPVFPLF